MKRLFDVAIAAVVLLVTLVLLVIIAILVRIKLGRPVLYTQERLGRHFVPCTLVEFRTMLELHGNEGELPADADRLTRFVASLTQTRLDELLELWNVLKGGMSLAGPRPLLMRYSLFYAEDELRRYEVRPGPTGWAHVNGRNELL